jgi:predicted DNA-binding transcriptional regulator YafY
VKSSRINRVIQILARMQAGESCTVDDLSEMFGTCRRTIFRDLKELQAMGVSYHFDNKTGGYALAPGFFLPPADLNLEEAMSLLLLTYKLSSQIQLPFKRSALLAALKIESNLPVQIRKYCSAALRNISTRADDQIPIRQHKQFDRIFTQLQEAIVRRRKVNICYQPFLEGEAVNIELCPYRLFYNNHSWHVLGRSSLDKRIHTCELNCIKELKITNERCPAKENFDVSEYLGKAWSMTPEGQIYHVKLHFLPKAAGSIAEIKWHKTQKVTRKDDGSAIVEFRVDGLNEITWWILGYGDQVRVLAPKALRERVLQIAKNMIELNQTV